MVETVVLRGIPKYVTVLDLADNLDKVLDRKINKYRVCELPDAKERLVALKFDLLDDAINAQKLLNGYKYILPGAHYVLNAELVRDVPTTERRVSKSSDLEIEVNSSPATVKLESDYIEDILSSPEIQDVVVEERPEKSAKRKYTVDEKILVEPKPKRLSQSTSERNRSRDRHRSRSRQSSTHNQSRCSSASTSSSRFRRGISGIDYSPRRNRFESSYDNSEPISSYSQVEYRPNPSENDDQTYCNVFKSKYNRSDVKTSYKPAFDDRQSYKPKLDYRNVNVDKEYRPKKKGEEDRMTLIGKIKKVSKIVRKEMKFTLDENCRKNNISKKDKKIIKRNLKVKVKKRMQFFKNLDAQMSLIDIIKLYRKYYSEPDDKIMVKKLVKEYSEMSYEPDVKVQNNIRNVAAEYYQTQPRTSAQDFVHTVIKTEEDKIWSAVDEVLQDLPFDMINSEDTNTRSKSKVKVEPDCVQESKKKRNKENAREKSNDQDVHGANIYPGPWICINGPTVRRRSVRPNFTNATKRLIRDLKPIYEYVVEEAVKDQFLAKASSVIRLRLFKLMKDKEYTKTAQICLLYKDLYGACYKETAEDFVKLIVRVLKEGKQADINVATYLTENRKNTTVMIKQEIEALPEETNSNEEMNRIQENEQVKREHTSSVSENLIESEGNPQVYIKQEYVENNLDVPDMETTNSTCASENVTESEGNPQVNIKQECVETNVDVPDMETINTSSMNENLIESDENPQVNIKQECVENNVDADVETNVPDMESTIVKTEEDNIWSAVDEVLKDLVLDMTPQI